MSGRDSPPIHGVDFTSRPRGRKPITVATGYVRAGDFALDRIECLPDFAAFETWLARPGPWVAGFDFPFGLPRMAVRDLGWPLDWTALASHCRRLGREGLRHALDRYRATRPVGDKYPYRRGDRAAGSHSPIKLVNPPVALMYLEGAPRLADARVHLPGIRPGDPHRVGLEAYPGYAARQLLAARVSYKNDAPAKQTTAHRAARARLVAAMSAPGTPLGHSLAATRAERARLVEDASGDRLDAVLCALQAAWGWQRRGANWGLPGTLDPLEGWIVGVPHG